LERGEGRFKLGHGDDGERDGMLYTMDERKQGDDERHVSFSLRSMKHKICGTPGAVSATTSTISIHFFTKKVIGGWDDSVIRRTDDYSAVDRPLEKYSMTPFGNPINAIP